MKSKEDGSQLIGDPVDAIEPMIQDNLNFKSDQCSHNPPINGSPDKNNLIGLSNAKQELTEVNCVESDSKQAQVDPLGEEKENALPSVNENGSIAQNLH